MANQMLPFVLLLLLGSLCSQKAQGRSITNPVYGPPWYSSQVSSNPELLNAELGLGADASALTRLNAGTGYGYAGGDLYVASFTDILFRQLLENNAFCDLFSNQISVENTINIGMLIGQTLGNEIGLGDSYWATNLLTNALTSINPNSGPEAFGRALADAAGQIILSNNILNPDNYYSLANTFTGIIVNSASSLYGNGYGSGIGLGVDIGTGFNLNGRNRIGVKTDVNANVGAGIGGLLNNIANPGLNIDRFAGDISVGAGFGLGAELDLAVGANIGTGADLGVNAGLGIANLGAELDFRSGIGLGALGVDAGATVGLGAGLGGRIGSDLRAGADLRLGASLNAGVAVGAGVSAGIGVDTGVKAGLDVSLDSTSLFKTELIKELLKDRYFRCIFSYYLPESSLKSVASAIAQYLATAFSVPRSSFLPLENVIILLANDKPTIEAYSNIISSTIEAVLQNKDIITPSAASLQVTIASKALSSGIANFLIISSVSGVGVGLSSNSYNSLFSILNGLGKLPYVGIDTASRKLPPIIKTAKATSSALQFAKVLFYNIVSSNEFYGSFSLGIPSSACKMISNALGDFMAEAFGSPKPSFFSDIYVKALLASVNNLNYKIYARIITVATTRALYLLGYFLSGNVNIQAAIAANAIIRALVLKTQKGSWNRQTNVLSEILSLPWATQITGVSSPNSLLNIKGVGLDADLGIGAGLNAELGAGINAGVGLGAEIGLEAGIGLDAGIDLGARIVSGASAGEGIDIGAGVGLEAGVGVRAGAEAAIGAGVGARIGADVGFEFDGGLDIDDFDFEIASAIQENLELNAALEASLKKDDKRKLLRSKRDIVTEVGNFETGLDFTESDIKRISNGQVSILEILPRLLANRLYVSTALYTTIQIVGVQNVVNLIAQSMADQFGFSVAAKFLESFKNNFVNTNKNFELSALAIAIATTDALAEVGILDGPFSIALACDLAAAVVLSYSSLLATSLQ